jgi:hypothetical protein
MNTYTSGQNNSNLLKLVLSDSLSFQENIIGLESKIRLHEQTIADMKKQHLKINMENGRLILQKSALAKEIKEKEEECFHLLESKDAEILSLGVKIKQLTESIAEITHKNGMLSDTCKIMLRQNSELNEKIKILSFENKSLLDKDGLLLSQINSFYTENHSLREQLKQAQDAIKKVEHREMQFMYSTAVNNNKFIAEITELKKENEALKLHAPRN